MSGGIPYTKITDPPKTVKEAIDWTLRVTKNDSRQSSINYDNFCKSLKAVLGSGTTIAKDDIKNLGTELSKLIGWNDIGVFSITINADTTDTIAGKDYTSAYKPDDMVKNNANWPTACKDVKEANASNSGKCCSDSSGANGCSSCKTGKDNLGYKDCDAEGCCNKCPKQICARMFCLIVPVLHSVFEFLKSKIENDWHGQGITGGEIGKFFEACGFEKNILNNGATGSSIMGQLKNVVEKLNTVKEALYKTLQTDSAKGKFLEGATNGTHSSAPNSICDILQWLQFLPYCTEYSKLKEKLDKYNTVASNMGKGFENLLKAVTSRLSMLFFFIEGKGNTNAQKGNSLFDKIKTLSKCQYIYDKKYYKAENAVKILLSVIPILHWSVENLTQKCGKGNTQSVSQSEHTKTFLKSLGWVDNSPGGGDRKIEGTMKCSDFKKYLDDELLGDNKVFKNIKDTIETAWRSHPTHTSHSASSVNPGNYEPNTILEMLLWLQCLPTSGVFEQLKSKVKGEKYGEVDAVMQCFTDILFKLPSLYHSVEGSFNNLLDNLFKHQGITDGGNAFSYGYDDGKCLTLFSAIVAILYMAFRYLQQRCNSVDGEWKELQLNGNGKRPSGGAEADELKKFFELIGVDKMTPVDGTMTGSAFKTGVLDTIFGDMTDKNAQDKLNKLYECAKKKLEGESSNGGTDNPKTIRQMMLWLIGLPLTKQYDTLTDNNGKLSTAEVQNVIVDTSSITSANIQENILSSASGLTVTMIVIEGNAKTVFDFLKGGFKDSVGTPYSYGQINDMGVGCLDLLKDYSYKVHCQLRFLHYMTKENYGNGGWKECNYANGAQQSSGKCSDCNANTSCLKLFLEGENQTVNPGPSHSTDTNQFYGLVTTGSDNAMKDVGMGFEGKMNGSKKRTGNDIKTILGYVCHANEGKTLTKLMEYIITIAQQEPTTLGDYVDLFRQFTCSKNGLWDQRKIRLNGNQQNINDRLTSELEVLKGTDEVGNEYVNELSTAIKSVYPQTHGNHSNQTYDLLSLGCSPSQKNDTCAPYIRPICHSVWNSYAPKIAESDPNTNAFYTLQWLYDMCYQLLRGLRRLKGEFDSCSCCSNGGCGSSMVECQKALPMLYKHGLAFHSPNTLNDDNKNCKGFMGQLTKLIDMNEPLYNVLKNIIDTFYHILLIKVKRCVATKADKLQREQVKTDKEQWKSAFEGYVKEAIEKSKNKLQCNFSCKLFGETNCKKHTSEPVDSTSVPNPLSPQKVTSIEAVIPRYTLPHIDLYDYKTYPKQGFVQGTEQINSHYVFSDAINFHVDRSQCITPTPVALRSVIDWLLRITVGKVENVNGNDQIKKLTDEINKLRKPGTDDGVQFQQNVSSLVSGLRNFVGYEENSNEVVKNIEEEKKTIKVEVEKRIKAIHGFITRANDFATEMGRALQKGKYEENGKLASGEQNKTFQEVIKLLQQKLNAEHNGCKSGVQCDKNNPATAITTSKTVEAEGLKQLHEFFEHLKEFAARWEQIGNDHGGSILQQQRDRAMQAIQYHGSQSQNGQYFTKLHEALKQLGECAQKVEALENNGSGYENSQQYRDDIQQLVTHLQNKVLSCFKDSSDNTGIGKSDPAYAVKAADALIKHTKARVVAEITKEIKDAVEEKYTELAQQYNGQCKSHSESNHKQLQEYLCIEATITTITDMINSEIEKYKEHLDDLKQLCQWLYRMGQLYHAGLHDFVKCLIEHLNHIIHVIKWIEGIEKMVKKLKEIDKKESILTVNGLNNGIEYCCTNKGHNSLYQSSKFKDRDAFFTALNCRIDNLLTSYVLGSLPDSTDKSEVATRRQLLTDLRLLALDRYSLQVWQDECSSEHCKIKDWITFNGGIIKCSNIDAIKKKVANLTGIDYNVPQKRTRIYDFHAICVIQKFSYEEPITQLERSLEKLKGIQKQLSEVKNKCDSQKGGELQKDTTVIQPFCKLVDAFLSDKYGIFSLAKFVHTILGPNIFSAVIAVLEELKEANKYQNGGHGNLDKIKGILEVLTQGLASDTANRDHYKLERIISKLQTFLTTLRSEYIFSYPVVTSNKASLPAGSQAELGIPTCYNTKHTTSSICDDCYPHLARIFIGAIPNLYRHCRLLYEMGKLDVNKEATWNNDRFVFKRNGVYSFNDGYLSLGGYMSCNGWIVKGLKEDADKNELYQLNPNEGISNVYWELNDILDYGKDDSTTKASLDKLFKAVMQHFKDKRDEKRKEREKKEREVFDKEPNNKGIPFMPPLPQLPSTVRQVLFWLHEMDTQGEFYKKLCDHIMQLCGKGTIGISHAVIDHVLKLSASQALEVLATIEDPGRQYPTYLYDLYTEEHYYAYPTVDIPLFFYTFVEKLMGAFLELNFVCVQCQFVRSQGGWSNCLIYSDDTVFSRSHKETRCSCTGLESTCPRPLYAILFGASTNQLKIPNYPMDMKPYMSKGTMPCGFRLSKTNNDKLNRLSSVTGGVLVEPLKKLVGGHVKGRLKDNEQNTLGQVIYLRDLLRYTLCLAVRPPWSMSENMAFFYRVTEAWKKDKKVVGGVRVAHHNPQLLKSIKDEINLFPGTFDGKLLTTAVERFAGLEGKNHDQRAGSTDSHHYDLRSLMGCRDITAIRTGDNGNCSPFMFPLALDVYSHYDHKNSRAYLSWILNFAFGIYDQLKSMEQRMTEQKCYSSSCDSLPKCPGVLTALYQSGSSFMDQRVLADVNTVNNTKKKTCDDFKAVLHGLFDCSQVYCTPLHNLIVQCEAFLWSIRLPFSLVQLSLWSVAILFISYVFVVPLDHFKIKSHLFNRLKYTMHPSLLISDGQRRVSEVAYFTL